MLPDFYLLDRATMLLLRQFSLIKQHTIKTDSHCYGKKTQHIWACISFPLNSDYGS